jgi:hypothetical protein
MTARCFPAQHNGQGCWRVLCKVKGQAMISVYFSKYDEAVAMKHLLNRGLSLLEAYQAMWALGEWQQ